MWAGRPVAGRAVVHPSACQPACLGLRAVETPAGLAVPHPSSSASPAAGRSEVMRPARVTAVRNCRPAADRPAGSAPRGTPPAARPATANAAEPGPATTQERRAPSVSVRQAGLSRAPTRRVREPERPLVELTAVEPGRVWSAQGGARTRASNRRRPPGSRTRTARTPPPPPSPVLASSPHPLPPPIARRHQAVSRVSSCFIGRSPAPPAHILRPFRSAPVFQPVSPFASSSHTRAASVRVDPPLGLCDWALARRDCGGAVGGVRHRRFDSMRQQK